MKPEVGDTASANRRSFLRRLGVVGAAGIAGSALRASSAEAADGGTFTGAESTWINNVADATKAAVRGEFSNANGTGVRGVSASGRSGAGVEGASAEGFGLYGDSTSGYAVFAGGNGRIGMGSHIATGAPTTGGYSLGDIVRNAAGDIWCCVVTNVDSQGNLLGIPAQFRKIAGPDSAGQWHPLTSPVLVYDNRFFNGAPGTGPKHSTGETRTVNFGLGSKFPPQATAVSANIIISATESSGYFTVIPGDGTFNGVGQIYWRTTNEILTFPTLIRVQRISGESRVKMITAAPCAVTVEVSGYFL